MSTAPRRFYLTKYNGLEIIINRTIRIIESDRNSFLVTVTDRDYEAETTGGIQTVVFRDSYDSLIDAEAEAEEQVDLSIAEGLVLNNFLMM